MTDRNPQALTESEKRRLLEIPADFGQVFRDFIPESEEHLHPGQGTGGVGSDFVPAGETAASMIRRQEQERELVDLERAEEVRAELETAGVEVKKKPRGRPPHPKG